MNASKKKPITDKLSAGQTGIAGEYFVAAELSRRGFMASITLRNNDSIDIHASKPSGETRQSGDNRMVLIQVKTTQQKTRQWPLSEKAERIYAANHFYVFVRLNGLQERPDYFIVPSEVVARTVQDSHSTWLNTPGKLGQAHNDSAVRTFADAPGDYLERWDLLG